MASSNLDIEINDMLTKLNDHLTTTLGAHQAGGAGHDEANKKHGMRVITLAGENNGAMMKASGGVEELVDMCGDDDVDVDGESVVSSYTNSNYQAVNNSMVVAGSCAVKDPGVHVITVEHIDDVHDEDDDDDDDDSEDEDQHRKKEKKDGKKKEIKTEKKGSSKKK